MVSTSFAMSTALIEECQPLVLHNLYIACLLPLISLASVILEQSNSVEYDLLDILDV